MTDRISELLKHIQKTNPAMSKERLLEELSKCRYSEAALVVSWRSGERIESL